MASRGDARDRETRQLQKAKEKAQRKGNLQEEAAVCNQLGEILARRGRFQEALEEHRQELRLLESVDDVIGCAVAHRKIGERLAELESYEAALKHQRRHLELAQSLHNHVEQQRAWATLGRTYMFMADSDPSSGALQEAEEAFAKSLSVIEETLDGEAPPREVREMRARLYLNLGLVYDSLKNPAKCSDYIKKSIYISEQAHLSEDLYRAYFNLGNIHLREGGHSKAMRCLERARECARKMKEKYMESECSASLAQVLLSLGDFVAAKRFLKKAYLLGSLQPQQRESVRRSLRYATKVSSLQQALEEAEASRDRQAAVGLCEQLGDLFSKEGDYQRALEAYRKQLGHAEAAKRPAHELAVIHVSLAATFGDLKDHSQAVRHYQAELALRQGNPLEEGKTWLNIALAKEEAQESYDALEPCFQNALRKAEEAGNQRLQGQILHSFHASQQRCGRPEASATLAQLKDLQRSLGRSSDGETGEEEEEPQSSEPLEESDLELSSSDGEDDLEGYGKSVPGRRNVSKWNQRNDKGETLLHRACIDGNLRRVQFLLEKAHPVSPRDYCGWTPLHEACNHGHLEIVGLLLDHGANIDDRGGPGCEGITPLHDALNCGHFDVAELLIRRGASVALRNAKGLNPLGTLQEWVRLYSRDLDRETRERCKAMEQLLRKAVANPGSKPQTPQGEPASPLFDSEVSGSQPSCFPRPAEKPRSPQRAPRQNGELGLGKARQGPREPVEDCMIPLRPVKKRPWLPGQDPPRGEEGADSSAAAAEYQAAMRQVGSAQSRRPLAPETTRPSDRSALIPPEEYVGDDWLEDDVGLGHGSRKRSRPSRDKDFRSSSEESSGPESESGGPHLTSEAARKKRRRLRQSRLAWAEGRTRGAGPTGSPGSAGDSSPPWGAGGSSPADSSTRGCESPPPGSAQLPVPPAPVRVRVRVHENIFLIPVPQSGSESRPVSWLADQASQRYYQTSGLLPHLTLKKEGALLAPQDLIVDVLQSNEEVLAEVQSWDLQPLPERYCKACRSLSVGEHPLLLKMLEHQESSPSFSASGITLRGLHLAPLLRALKKQTSIQRLCLSGTALGDDSAAELLASISTMPSLKTLDLSANQLGPKGLDELARGPSGPVTFQNLEELDLSLNPLGDGSTQALASLLQACPLLSKLHLRACGFTPAFLQHHRPLVANALRGAVHLRWLAVSHNALDSPGLDLLLQCLPSAALTHLDAGCVVASTGNLKPPWDVMVKYLVQEGCAVTHLTFSGNRLTDEAVAELARGLPTCRSLVSLDLSANPDISIVGLRTLLTALEERQKGLQLLSLTGCSVKGPLDFATWNKLSANVRHLQLCTRHLSPSDQLDVAELWPRPPGAVLRTVTWQHKLFCQCLAPGSPATDSTAPSGSL
ncbi:tonsoku-like protein [Sphaerodactylus townsendi]|uniref:tonsoku-like protein n=1 Tax=Sphaerodactylus townsendi TaxID=933632 RepID=UPI00202728D8|nr:tonsoku-like protein [Sphaerodactylus townsendi]